MSADRLKSSSYVLVFNWQKTLVAIVRSATTTGQLTGCAPQSIYRTAQGGCISAGGWYFRSVPPDISISLEDLNTLKLEEYDALCEVERVYHTTTQMARNFKRSRGEPVPPIKRKTKKRKKNENKDHQQIKE